MRSWSPPGPVKGSVLHNLNITGGQQACHTDEDRITLVKNALSDKRNEVKRLNPVDNNIGGQSLLNDKNTVFRKDPTDKYLVETIYMDDLVDVLPRRADGSEFTDAIVKIDIEGFEPFAFVHAEKLFKKLNVNIIFME